MRRLDHACSAVHHAEALADEAEDAGNARLARRLRRLARRASSDIDRALQSPDEVEVAREVRRRTHEHLTRVYKHQTAALARLLGTESAARLSPPLNIDVADRMRFRLRALERLPNLEPAGLAAIGELRRTGTAALQQYEQTLDDYLAETAMAATLHQRAYQTSQVLRVHLQRAKQKLLLLLDPTSEAHQRVRRRAVMTNRSRVGEITDGARSCFRSLLTDEPSLASG